MKYPRISWACSLWGGSITDGWSINQILSKRFWPDQLAAAPLKRVAKQRVAWGGRFHSNQFKTSFYPPAIKEWCLFLSALGNRVVRGGVTPPAPNSLYSRLLDTDLKMTWTGFPPSQQVFSSCQRLRRVRFLNCPSFRCRLVFAGIQLR